MMTPLTSLNAPQTVFCLFYAIFWGLVANAQIRWKAFDWPLAVAGRSDSNYAPSWKRLKRSVVYLTWLPVFLFVVIVALLTVAPPRPLGGRLIIQLAGAVLAAHAAFSPYRLWLSGVERFPGDFYYRTPPPAEPAGTAPSAAGLYASQPRQKEDILLDPKWADTNRQVGRSYVGLSLLFALASTFLG
jgi:hypothetical protein